MFDSEIIIIIENEWNEDRFSKFTSLSDIYKFETIEWNEENDIL